MINIIFKLTTDFSRKN